MSGGIPFKYNIYKKKIRQLVRYHLPDLFGLFDSGCGKPGLEFIYLGVFFSYNSVFP